MLELDDFAELDAAIAKELEKSDEEKRLKSLKKRVFGTNATKTEREQHAAEVAALELKIIWEPQAQVVLFKRATCKCCHEVSTAYEATMIELRHRTNKNSRRWAVMPEIGSDLPKKVMFHDIEAPICWQCLPSLEWNLLEAEVHCTAKEPAGLLESMLNELEEETESGQN